MIERRATKSEDTKFVWLATNTEVTGTTYIICLALKDSQFLHKVGSTARIRQPALDAYVLVSG
jgi:hypothetical protein